MIKYLKDLWQSRILVQTRNFFGIKPQHRKWHYLKSSFSATDAFFWRSDENFKTIFKYSDIIGKYYNKKSKILFVFLDSGGNHILSKEVTLSHSVQTLVIDKSLLGIEGYGSFFAYNIPADPGKLDYKVTNRCYTGFAFKSNGPSFVHGNSISRYLSAGDVVECENDASQSAIFDHNIKSIYVIQKNFSRFDRNELFFFNPMKRDLSITINGTEHLIGSLCTQPIQFKGGTNKVAKILSNYNFARPIIFSYRKGYLDVHHA